MTFAEQWRAILTDFEVELDKALLACFRAQGYLLPGAVSTSRSVAKGDLRRCPTCDAFREWPGDSDHKTGLAQTGRRGPRAWWPSWWCAREDDWPSSMPDDAGVGEDCPVWQPLVLIRCARCRQEMPSNDACVCDFIDFMGMR